MDEITEAIERIFDRIRAALPNLDPHYSNFETLAGALQQVARWTEEHDKTKLYPESGEQVKAVMMQSLREEKGQ